MLSQKLLLKYDFDFSAWPVDYDTKMVEKDESKPKLFIDHINRTRSITEVAKLLPCRIIGYLVAHTVGIFLLYPGTIIQHFIGCYFMTCLYKHSLNPSLCRTSSGRW